LYNRTELRVIDIASKKVDTALDGKYNYSYSDGDITYTWSPDSRWFLIDYIGIGGWNNSDIALVKADGSEVVDLTESGYTNSNPRWAMGGRAVTYETSRYGMRSHGSWGEQSDVEIMALDGDAWDELNRTEEEASIAKDEEKAKDDEKSDDKAKDKKKGKKDGKKDGKADKKDDEVKPLEFDLANRKFRVRRLTAISGVGDYWVDNDGANIYYTAGSSEGGSNLMVRDLRKGETKVLVKGRVGGLEPDKKGENLFALGNGMCKIAIPDGKRDDIEFEAPYDRHPSQEREYIYNHMLRQVRDKFYDASLHGVDWDMYGENYARFLPHINNNYDFAELLSEILGELNASHTGGRYYAPGADLATANLGAFFDQNYTGDGLKVSEVVKRGPLADKKANVQAGDIITAIDGEQILADADYYPLLDGKAGKPVRLTIKRNGGKTEDITVRPIDTGKLNDLLYQRWVERNQAVVDSLSNGRVGYVHIEGMDSSSFREVYSQLLGKYRNCEAVVVDTRWNGGGWLHNDIALLLSGKEYVRYSPQGQYIGSDPFSQWTKPSAMLVCEGNYSDAHGTPYVYQTLKIGDIIGAPVPGTMTAVWWETQIDPSLIFGIPQVTSLDRNGKPLENQQLNPDVVIYNNPADVLNGKDDQLIGAVNHLLNALK
jgi:C-terminal processing protease CtpA/Prc